MLDLDSLLLIEWGFLKQGMSFLLFYLLLRWMIFGSKPPKFLPGLKQFLFLGSKLTQGIRQFLKLIWKFLSFLLRGSLASFKLVMSLPRLLWRLLLLPRGIYLGFQNAQFRHQHQFDCPHCHLTLQTHLSSSACQNCRAVNTAVHLMDPCHFCQEPLLKNYNCPFCKGTIMLRRGQNR